MRSPRVVARHQCARAESKVVFLLRRSYYLNDDKNTLVIIILSLYARDMDCKHDVHSSDSNIRGKHGTDHDYNATNLLG